MPRLIEVTAHALSAWRTRWPTNLEHEDLRQVIVREVEDAFVEGRFASKLPRFAIKPGSNNRALWRNGNERDRTMRVAWVPDETRCYLIDRRGDILRVVTSILPGEGDSPNG